MEESIGFNCSTHGLLITGRLKKYFVFPFKASDKGTYTAIAYSDEGTAARSNANVAIKSRLKEGVERMPPSFTRPMGDVAVDEGQKLRITTPVKGNPIPEFRYASQYRNTY